MRDRFVEHATTPAQRQQLETPLAHFLRFLLLTLERDARPLFEALCDKYRRALSRDPEFGSYMVAIGSRFFGIAPPNSAANSMLSNLMSMLKDGGGLPGGGGGGRPVGALGSGASGPRGGNR